MYLSVLLPLKSHLPFSSLHDAPSDQAEAGLLKLYISWLQFFIHEEDKEAGCPTHGPRPHWIQLVLSVNSLYRLGISSETHRHLKLMVKDTRSITKKNVLHFNLASYNLLSFTCEFCFGWHKDADKLQQDVNRETVCENATF